MITSIASRRQQHKEELRRVILDAAREIFVDQGYESFSMRRLAEKIEYSPGSIYLHFKNKEKLFEVLVEESFVRTTPLPKRPYKIHEAFGVLRDMVGRCVEEKRFRAVDVELTSQALWSSIHGITSLLIQRPKFPWRPKRELIGHVIFTATESLIKVPNVAKR
jgi:AcrR family transcriptional regulator